MVKAKVSGTLNVLMNGRLVGFWHQSTTGANTFQYAEEWLATPGARPLSLSMPLRSAVYEGQQVYNFFENLLPDSKDIRNKMQTRFQTSTNQPFDLLSAVGSDCAGAVQLCHQLPGLNIKTVTKQDLTEAEIAKHLRKYKIAPLSMARERDDFRISIAGAQEKTGLLWHNQKWCLPTGTTPTSHIIKFPIGIRDDEEGKVDLSESCENEWLCLKIAEAFGLPVAKADIQTFEDVKVLVVERFDRKWSRDGSWLMRLPQEDMCQVLGIASDRKYQANGGPSIVEIMKVLIGSKQPQVDRAQFFKTQILFWLLAAIDGHGKNFSVYLDPNASYRLTPLYDVLSVYPSMKTKEIPKQKAKMAMALKGKKNRYVWSQIQLRHFLSTAQATEFSQKQAISLLLEMLEKAEFIAQQIQKQLPKDFPTHISQSILEGMTSLAKHNLPTLYQLIGNHAEKGDYESAISLYRKAISLKAEIENEQGKVVLLNHIADLYKHQNDVDHAIEYYTKSLDAATQYDDIHSKALNLHTLADIYINLGKMEHALIFYDQALSLEELLNNEKGKAATLHQMGSIYSYQRDFDKALSFSEKSLKLKDKIGDIQGRAITLHQIAGIHTERGERDKALSLYQETLEIEKQFDDWQGRAATLHQIAGLYEKQGEKDKALYHYQEAQNIDERINNELGKATALHQMADIYAEEGDGDKALALYRESLELKTKANDDLGKATTLAMMGQLLANDFDDLATAKAYLHESLQIFRERKSPKAGSVEEILNNIQAMSTET